MKTEMSRILTLLSSIIVIMTPTEAIWHPPVECNSITRYSGSSPAIGRTFQADSRLCAQAIDTVLYRTPRDENIPRCAPYRVSFNGIHSRLTADVYNVVKCPATPDDVYLYLDDIGYGTFYKEVAGDIGCNWGDGKVAAVGAFLRMR